jgi:hypothetical protein
MDNEKAAKKLPWFQIIKCGWRHRLGNLISAFVNVSENLIIILTLGFIYPNFAMKWMMYRLFDSKLYYESNHDKDKNELKEE